MRSYALRHRPTYRQVVSLCSAQTTSNTKHQTHQTPKTPNCVRTFDALCTPGLARTIVLFFYFYSSHRRECIHPTRQTGQTFVFIGLLSHSPPPPAPPLPPLCRKVCVADFIFRTWQLTSNTSLSLASLTITIKSTHPLNEPCKFNTENPSAV